MDDGVLLAWYPDADQDGFGEQPTAVRDPVVWACSAPPGHLADHTDCDDSDGDVFLGNTENIAGVTIFPHDLCDGVDNDCMPGNDVDPPAVCGPGSQEFTWGGSRYLLRDRNLYDTPRAEEWCTERGYHLWHVGAGGGSEHTFVAGSYALPPIITGVGTTIPARAHVGARTQCPTASTFIPCFLSPSGVVCLPSQREQWQWWDPRTYTCWSAVDDMPSWMPESSGDYLVVHNLLNTFLPNLTVADPEDDAYVICERELP